MMIYGTHSIIENNVINNPTFTGEVVGKDTVVRHYGFTMTPVTEFRLHIVGEYIKNDKTIYVDRFFTVSRFIYSHFGTGDIICHGDSLN